jgi:hypothetical protein
VIRQLQEFRCSRCGSSEGYHSRPRNLLEKYFLPIVFVQPVRCGQCFRRQYRSSSVVVAEPKDPSLPKAAT